MTMGFALIGVVTVSGAIMRVIEWLDEPRREQA